MVGRQQRWAAVGRLSQVGRVEPGMAHQMVGSQQAAGM